MKKQREALALPVVEVKTTTTKTVTVTWQCAAQVLTEHYAKLFDLPADAVKLTLSGRSGYESVAIDEDERDWEVQIVGTTVETTESDA